ncbi:MAG: non-heme iron oxygenase ferredoxin subunit [Nocardioidaceae bacterium]
MTSIDRDRSRLRVWESEGGHLGAVPSFTSVQATATHPGPPEGIEWWPVVPALDLAPDSAVHVDVDGHPVCLVQSGGEVYALLDECSHGQVALSDGDVFNGLIECWQHGSCFDLSSGEPTGPPATARVPVFQVRSVAAVIEVAVPSGRSELNLS